MVGHDDCVSPAHPPHSLRQPHAGRVHGDAGGTNAPSPCQACRVCILTVLYALVLAQDRVISPGALPYPHEQGDTKLLLSVLDDLGCPSPHNAVTSG